MAKTAELPYRTLPRLPFKGTVSRKEIIRAVRAALRTQAEEEQHAKKPPARRTELAGVH
jgi:hypothetical protein